MIWAILNDYIEAQPKLGISAGVVVYAVQLRTHPELLKRALLGKGLPPIRITDPIVKRAWVMGKCQCLVNTVVDTAAYTTSGVWHDDGCESLNRARLFVREQDRRAA